MKKIIAFIFCLLFIVQPGFTVTYYVATDGNNSTGDGSEGNPWAHPGYGTTQMNGGDTLIVLGGTYILSNWDTEMIYPPKGTSANWTVLKGEEGNTPVLKGESNFWTAIGANDFMIIENFEITNNNGAWLRRGIHSNGLIEHVIMKDLHIHHLDCAGIEFNDLEESVIENCNIHHCGFGAIMGGSAGGDGWKNVTVKNCQLSYSGHYYQGGPGPSIYDRPDGFGIEDSVGPIEFVNCIVEHNRGDGLDCKINTGIYNCVVANNRGDGIKLWDGGIVENCLIYGLADGIAGSYPWSSLTMGSYIPGSTFEIINCTIHDNPTRTGYISYTNYGNSTVINVSMINCIFSNSQGEVWLDPNVNFTATNNLFQCVGKSQQVYANGRNYTAAEINAGELGSGNISADPYFICPAWGIDGDYHLKSNSPCINTGSTTVLNTDIDDNVRPIGAGTDMGCYEFYPGTPATSSVIIE